jgi:uncharacterized RDD family membrane protein YckC
MANPYAPPTVSTEVLPYPADFGVQGFPAERGTRLAAHIVDNLLYLPTLIPGAVLVAVLENTSAAWDSAATIAMAFGSYGLLIAFPLALASYQWYLVAKTGQSLAKRWFRIRIVRLDGSLPGFVYGVLLRSWVIQLLNAACNLVGLIDALMIFGQESRCLHDQLAGTKVIKT